MRATDVLAGLFERWTWWHFFYRLSQRKKNWKMFNERGNSTYGQMSKNLYPGSEVRGFYGFWSPLLLLRSCFGKHEKICCLRYVTAMWQCAIAAVVIAKVERGLWISERFHDLLDEFSPTVLQQRIFWLRWIRLLIERSRCFRNRFFFARW